MPSRLDYARLLDELNRLPGSDGQAIRDWLREQSTSDRVRHDPFVPRSLEEIESPRLPPLQSGDIVASPVIAPVDRYVVPAGSQLESSVQVAGTLVLERDVHASEALCAGQQIVWQGGSASELQNLVTPRLRIESPPGRVRGGIWCDALVAEAGGAHLPAGLRVEGVVLVDSTEGAVVVGHGARLGGLVTRAAARTEYGVSVGRLFAGGAVRVGRDNLIGVLEAASVEADRDSRLGVVVSAGTVTLAAGVVVESIRAAGDIIFEGDITVTGDALISTAGTLRVPAGEQWSSRREHWFFALPDRSLVPFRPDIARPERTALVALRSLTHSLWLQTHQVAGRNP